MKYSCNIVLTVSTFLCFLLLKTPPFILPVGKWFPGRWPTEIQNSAINATITKQTRAPSWSALLPRLQIKHWHKITIDIGTYCGGGLPTPANTGSPFQSQSDLSNRRFPLVPEFPVRRGAYFRPWSILKPNKNDPLPNECFGREPSFVCTRNIYIIKNGARRRDAHNDWRPQQWRLGNIMFIQPRRDLIH